MSDDEYNSESDEDYKEEDDKAASSDEEDVEDTNDIEEVAAGDDETSTDGQSATNTNESSAEADADAVFAALMAGDAASFPATSSATPSSSSSKPSEQRRPANGPSSSRTEMSEKATVKIQEEFDFAGDIVKIERDVTVEELTEIENKEKAKAERREKLKRPGIGDLVSLMEKKKKMSVLDKSNHDWKSFKTEHNLTEDLQTFNKGKDGFLNKMDFLSRTDHRQFEKEKAIRESLRKPQN